MNLWRLAPRVFAHSCLVWVATCAAQSLDPITLRAGLTVATDDNFFRTTTGAVSERISTQTVGVNLALPYSLQRFELDASLVGSQHQTYSNFDFTGKNYSAAWRWSITPQLHGNLTTGRTETLNAAADNLTPNLRNQNTSITTGFETIYELGGPWQLNAGLNRSQSLNERAVLGQGDNQSSSYSVGARFSLASGSAIGYSLQRSVGSNTSDFTGTNHIINGTWPISGNTTLTGRVSAVDQRFGAAPQFSFSGVAGGLNLSVRTSGKTALNAGWSRDLTSFPSTGATHTLTDAITVAPTWEISPKTRLGLQYRGSLRVDQGNPTGTPSTRQDRVQDISATFSWDPRPFASLSATITESRRASNVVNQDFVGKIASVSAQFNF